MTLEEARAAIDLKAVVIYSPGAGDPETGMVTSVSETMALVRYGADTFAKATRPEDLAFMFVSDAMLARKRAGAAAGGAGPRGASFSNGPLEPRSLRDLPRTETIFNLMEPRPYQ